MNSIAESHAVSFGGYAPTWCPGCGNFGIWASLKEVFKKLGYTPSEMAIVFGIGCSGNMNDFLWATSFHALHGRAIPTAIGVKLACHTLPVVVIAGDGDTYGEGGNHFLHACRGNHDITVIVHDNRVYGLTTGQVAPTALKGFQAKSTPEGIIESPVNPLALGITQGASYVAQGFSANIPELTDMIVAAISHKGFSLVNVLQPCVTFNKQSTYAWYRERVYSLDKTNHDPADFKKALDKSVEGIEKIPVGILYNVDIPTYTDGLPVLKEKTLVQQELSADVASLIEEYV